MILFFLSVIGCNSDKPSNDVACGFSESSFVRSRTIQGDVLWLPTPIGDGCAEGEWGLADGESLNGISNGDDWSSITLDATGIHRFHYNDFEIEVDVRSPDDAPFHNLAYYPGETIAQVGDAWWVAQAFSPEISVISNGELTAEIAVGPWPVALAVTPDAATVLVATRANDSIGVVSVAERRIVSTIHVGDEPAHIEIDPTGRFGYVSLNTESSIAVIDLQLGQVTGVWPSVTDVSAFDLNSDGSRIVAFRIDRGGPREVPMKATTFSMKLMPF